MAIIMSRDKEEDLIKEKMIIIMIEIDIIKRNQEDRKNTMKIIMMNPKNHGKISKNQDQKTHQSIIIIKEEIAKIGNLERQN